MNQSKILLKVYGARGSYPTDGPDYNLVGGLTSSLALEAAGKTLLFDAGSGIRHFCSEFDPTKHRSLYLFLSHLHLDHIVGLVGFTPIYHPNTKIYFYGPRCDRFPSLEKALQTIFSPPFHPLTLWEMRSQKEFYNYIDGDKIAFQEDSDHPILIPCGTFNENDYPVTITCIRNYSHPKSGVTIFCIYAYGKRIIYATDIEGRFDRDPRVAKFADRCDLLIHDSMYSETTYNNSRSPRRGFGHSTVIHAVEMAKRCNTKQLLLFHHDPDTSDDKLLANLEAARKQFPATSMACRGDIIEI